MIKNMKRYGKQPIQGRLLQMYVSECKCGKNFIMKPTKTYSKIQFFPDTKDKYLKVFRRYEGRCSSCGTYWHKDWIISETEV